MSNISATKTGRCFNGSEKDRGVIVHIVNDWTHYGESYSKTLCGTEPGYRGNGWSKTDKTPTCKKCIKQQGKL